MSVQLAVKERPILFSGEMVRAILADKKTQTRRIVKPQPGDTVGPSVVTAGGCVVFQEYFGDMGAPLICCPYGVPGDRLWVREAFTDRFTENDHGSKWAAYRADGRMIDHATGQQDALVVDMHWRPSIFMPRWACRLVLEVVAVRVERVQQISEADVRAEGVSPCLDCDTYNHRNIGKLWHAEDYRALWDKINAKRAPWVSNPWVWVVEFRKVPA